VVVKRPLPCGLQIKYLPFYLALEGRGIKGEGEYSKYSKHSKVRGGLMKFLAPHSRPSPESFTLNEEGQDGPSAEG